MDDIWFWIVATVAAYYIKGLCGFANILVFTSIMAFGANNVNISPVELVLGLPSNMVLTFKNRKKLNHKVWIPLAILVLVGSIPGALMLKNIDVTIVKIFFGIVVVLLGIEMLLREKEVLKVRESYFILMVIGIMSGVLCGLFGVGALLAAYVGRVTNSSDEFKANISSVFIVDNIFRMILYSVLGIISFSTLKSSVILMPLMLLGLFAGMKSSQILDEKKARHLVIVLLIISGISMVVLNM